MNWKNCLESKNIKKDENAPERIPASLEMSERFLIRQEKTCQSVNMR